VELTMDRIRWTIDPAGQPVCIMIDKGATAVVWCEIVKQRDGIIELLPRLARLPEDLRDMGAVAARMVERHPDFRREWFDVTDTPFDPEPRTHDNTGVFAAIHRVVEAARREGFAGASLKTWDADASEEPEHDTFYSIICHGSDSQRIFAAVDLGTFIGADALRTGANEDEDATASPVVVKVDGWSQPPGGASEKPGERLAAMANTLMLWEREIADMHDELPDDADDAIDAMKDVGMAMIRVRREIETATNALDELGNTESL
jgi:hypothetical protein